MASELTPDGGVTARALQRRRAVFCVVVMMLASGLAHAQCPNRGPASPGCAFVDLAGWGIDTAAPMACEAWIMRGCGGSYFCPGEHVSREDMAVHLEQLIEQHLGWHEIGTAPAAGFSDVPPGYCLGRWIDQLAWDRITLGTTVTTYTPYGTVNRAQMAMFVARALKFREANPVDPGGRPAEPDPLVPWSGTVPGKGSYQCICTEVNGQCPAGCPTCTGGQTQFPDDVAPSALHCRHVHYMAGLGVTLGCTSTSFCSSSPVTRAAMVLFMCRAHQALSGAPTSQCS